MTATATMGPRFGLLTPIVMPINRRRWEREAGTAELDTFVAAAERLGYWFVTANDHTAVHRDDVRLYGSPPVFFDPIATLGWIAARTETIRLLTYVYQLPLRNVLVTSKAMSTLDVLSRGRLIVGVGVGRREREAHVAGIPFAARGAIADEQLAAMPLIWGREHASYHGNWVQFADLVVEPRPVQRPHPPIWVGGNSLAAARRAIRFGTAWLPNGIPAATIADVVARISDLPEYDAHRGAFAVIAPFAPLGGRAGRTEQQPAMEDPAHASIDRVLHELALMRESGVTDFVLELPGASLQHVLEAMDWFRDDVTTGACASWSAGGW